LETTSATNAVMRARSTSFQRPGRPSERRCVSFVQSSTKPIAAQAIVTKKAVNASSVRSEKTRKGTNIAAMISSPPIVGVPCLTTWPVGPSSRMCWPNSLRRRNSMNFGPATIAMTMARMPDRRTWTTSGVRGQRGPVRGHDALAAR
jgi:hypothetical protein